LNAPYESLRPAVDTADDLYALLQALQARSLASVGWRLILLIVLLAVGLIAPGAAGSAALCLAAIAGMACIWAIADNVARNWFLHALTLHELIRPRFQSADELFADWIKPEEQQVQ